MSSGYTISEEATDLDEIFTTKNFWLDGNLYVWGLNDSGQLGLDDTAARSSPVLQGNLNTWTSISSGTHMLALRVDGSLWAWGLNSSGQLGLGDTGSRSSPTLVDTNFDWYSISAGSTHSLSIKSDGSLWSWGDNTDGQLGLGDTTNRSLPIQVGTKSDWKNINAGYSVSCAIDNVGALWAWGDSIAGELGTNDDASKSLPTQIGLNIQWRHARLGLFTTTSKAVSTDGSLWVWGINSNGGLGINESSAFIIYSSPVQLGSDYDWSYVSERHVIKTDGSLWAWGNNTDGQLGLGDTTARSSPVQVGLLTDWKQVFFATNLPRLGTNERVFALKTDGTLWGWGYNVDGGLGLSDTTNRSSPVQIGSLTYWGSITTGSPVNNIAAILDTTDYLI